jgi:adenosylcobinamide-GDP ribazoletransferase
LKFKNGHNAIGLIINFKMKTELRILFTALMFYTRIPCPSWVDHSPDYVNKATRYFPFIGWIVGGISFLFFLVGYYLFDSQIGVVLSLVAGMLTTGAFHEDGFADAFDGFGGGWTKDKILAIMKDSRIGTYGVLALVCLVLFKFLALSRLASVFSYDPLLLLVIFIAYHSIARLTAISIVFSAQYAREDGDAKAKPVAQAFSFAEVFGAFFFGLVPLLVLAYFSLGFLWLIFPLGILRFYAIGYFNKWIGGYTGDGLGAVEQVAELTFVMGCLLVIAYNT